MAHPRVSLLDIAHCLGVSVSTVSRALRNDPSISVPTRESIRRTAESLGYHPDPIAAALAQNRWHTPADLGALTIAYLHCTPTGSPEIGMNHFLPGYVERAAAERGYKVERFNLAEYASGLSLSRILYNRGIRGVLIAPVFVQPPAMVLEWSRFSLVSLGPGYYPLPLHCVYFSAYDQMDVAIQQTWNAGYRRIGVVLLRHPEVIEDDNKRFGAALANQRILRERGGSLHLISYQAPAPAEYPGHSRRLRDWFKTCRPEVVIGFNGLVYHSLREFLPARCPDDYAFANLHWDDAHGQCAGVRQGSEASARLGVQVLEMLLRANETGLPPEPLRYNVNVSWLEGSTMPRRRPPPRALSDLPLEA